MAVANGRVEKEIGAKGFWGEGAKSWIIPRLILSLSLSLCVIAAGFTRLGSRVAARLGGSKHAEFTG